MLNLSTFVAYFLRRFILLKILFYTWNRRNKNFLLLQYLFSLLGHLEETHHGFPLIKSNMLVQNTDDRRCKNIGWKLDILYPFLLLGNFPATAFCSTTTHTTFREQAPSHFQRLLRNFLSYRHTRQRYFKTQLSVPEYATMTKPGCLACFVHAVWKPTEEKFQQCCLSKGTLSKNTTPVTEITRGPDNTIQWILKPFI